VSVHQVIRGIIQNVPQQDVHGLTTCSWDHFESKISNKHASDLPTICEENENVAFTIFTLFPFNFWFKKAIPVAGHEGP
jgi:hypothetical protein